MLVDRDAATVVGDGQAVTFLQRHLDPVGVAGHGLVHRVVEHFGGQMMQCPLIGAADIHAGAAPDRLKPFQHLDRGTVIGIAAALRQLLKQVISHSHGYRPPGFP